MSENKQITSESITVTEAKQSFVDKARVALTPLLEKALGKGHNYVEFHSVDKELVVNWCRTCGTCRHIRKGKTTMPLLDEYWYPNCMQSSEVEFSCKDVIAQKVVA